MSEEKNIEKNEEMKKDNNAKVESAKSQKDEKKTDEQLKDNVSEKKDLSEKEKKSLKKDAKIKEIVKKEEAVARGYGMHMSMKQAKYICKFIQGKKIDLAINDLEKVVKMKKAVPFKGEIPHRKGVGMMSGRYPVKASGLIIKTLKGLKGNVVINGIDLDQAVIYFASASWASRPLKKGNRQAKRVNLILKAKVLGDKKNG